MREEMRNRPSKVFRCGAVRAAVWTNQRVMDNAVVEVHSIKIDKSYKDGDEWKRTTSFAAEDLPKVSVVAMASYKHLRLRSDEPSAATNSRESTDDIGAACGDRGRSTGPATSKPQQG